MGHRQNIYNISLGIAPERTAAHGPAVKTAQPQVELSPAPIVRICIFCALLPLFCLTSLPRARAAGYQGFLQPFQTIDVAAAESGVVTELRVDEGSQVTADQLVARLDRDVLLAALAVAERKMAARGPVESARAEVEHRRRQLEQLRLLRAKGHGQPSEIQRAETNLAIAEAGLLTAQEDIAVRRLERDEILARLQRRDIRVPVAGVVTTIYKEPGEYVAANTPVILTVVQLDQLLGVFSLPAPVAYKLAPNQTVSVIMWESGRAVRGAVHHTSPVADAESGTVRVEVRINNSEYKLHSGAACRLIVPDKPPSPGG